MSEPSTGAAQGQALGCPAGGSPPQEPPSGGQLSGDHRYSPGPDFPPGDHGQGCGPAVPDLSVSFCGIQLRNPVTVASGTFGYAREFSPFVDLDKLGAITVKGVSLAPWPGNPPPRLAETPAGMLNSIGLENPGVEAFIREELPLLRTLRTPVIVNVVGRSTAEYCRVVDMLSETEGISALEVNISCPNIKEGGLAFGTDAGRAASLIEEIRPRTRLPIITKLSPNVTDIGAVARAVVGAGSDALSLVNTFLGMAIDVDTQRPILGNVFGGLSGPAIRPIAVRMVWQVFESVGAPIVGMGGIASARDAVEFMLAGAMVVAVGTANFINPGASLEIIEGIREYMGRKNLGSVKDLVGGAHRDRR